MPKFADRELAGWGRFPRQQCRVARAEKRRELATLALDCEVPSLLARGLGRAYGDAALNQNSGVVLTEKLNRFLDFDDVSGILKAEAGVSFASIAEVFVPRGHFLPVVPGSKWITLGGAIAADVHGKNHVRDGSISNFLESLELVLASGETICCSRTENSDAFWATIGGMGLTGIIAAARLRLVPIETTLVRVKQQKARDLDALLALWDDRNAAKYEVAWLDCLAAGENLGRSILMRGEPVSLLEWGREKLSTEPLQLGAPRGTAIPVDLPAFALNSLSVKAFNAAYFASHREGEEIQGFEPFFWPLDAISDWNRIYGARGFVQYQCLLPFETARDGLKRLLETIAASGHAAFLGVLKKYGAADEVPLGFARPGYGLALDLPASPEIAAFAQSLDAITLAHGGRVYLAKDSTLAPTSLRQMYPRLGDFERVKATLDPHNRFQSSLSRRLEIGVATGVSP